MKLDFVLPCIEVKTIEHDIYYNNYKPKINLLQIKGVFYQRIYFEALYLCISAITRHLRLEYIFDIGPRHPMKIFGGNVYNH